MAKHPGTSGLMPVKGSGCGIRPNVDEMENSEGFDFSGAAELLPEDDSITAEHPVPTDGHRNKNVTQPQEADAPSQPDV